MLEQTTTTYCDDIVSSTGSNGSADVTVVGATTGYPESAAWRKLSSGLYCNSGAGFANYFDQPAYQAKAVNAYVAGLDGLYDGLYNKSGKLTFRINETNSAFSNRPEAAHIQTSHP